MTERRLRPKPDWCKQIECPNYTMDGYCILQKFVIDGTFSQKERKPTYELYSKMSTDNPEKLKERCQGRFMRI